MEREVLANFFFYNSVMRMCRLLSLLFGRVFFIYIDILYRFLIPSVLAKTMMLLRTTISKFDRHEFLRFSLKHISRMSKKEINSSLLAWQKDALTIGTEQSRCLSHNWLYYTYCICLFDLCTSESCVRSA